MKNFSEAAVGSIFDEEEIEALRTVLFSGQILSRGSDIDLFEEEFAKFCGAKYAIAMSSCTAALRIGTQLLRLGKGDEVIIPANSFWNTVVTLVEKEVTLKIADIEDDSLNIDPKSIASLISSKTKAVFIYDHGGNPCNLKEIRELCDKHNLPLLEDAAHSVGGSFDGKMIGTIADLTCFSFSTLKNMVTLGEGGMLTTNNAHWAEWARKLRQSFPMGIIDNSQNYLFGDYEKPKDLSFMKPGDAYTAKWIELQDVGNNFKMTTPQASVGRVQLKKLSRMNARRAEIGKQYAESISRFEGLRPLKILNTAVPSWHFYSFFIKEDSGVNRNQFMEILSTKHDVHLTNRYWPIHLNSLLRSRGHNLGEAPVCERVWFKEQVSLPIAPSFSDETIKELLDAVIDSYTSLGGK